MNSFEGRILGFTVGTTIDYNLRYGIYFDDRINRSNKQFNYIFLYAEGKIRAIGKLERIVCCEFRNGGIVEIENAKFDRLRDLSDEQHNRLIALLKNFNLYDINAPRKYFLVDKFYKIDLKTRSFMSEKYFNLEELIPGYEVTMLIEDIVQRLNAKRYDIVTFKA